MKKWLWVVMLAGCATSSTTTKEAVSGGGEVPAQEEAARARVRAALAALPRCAPGAPVGALTVRATVCTKMFCDQACCNQCGWAASFDTLSGALPADPARVRELLHLPESALECEIAAWSEALRGQSISLEAPACVVR